MHRIILFTLTFCTLTTLSLLASEFEVGDKVFLKPDVEVALRGGQDAVSNPAIVLKVDGNQLLLEKSWVDKNNVLSPDEAVEFYSEEIRLAPTNDSLWKKRGLARQTMLDYFYAVKDFEQAAKLNPSDSMNFVFMGECRESMNDFKLADRHFTDAIRIDPQNVKAFQCRGHNRTGLRRFDEAIADLSMAIKLDPGSAQTFDRRGSLWFEKKRYNQAIKDYSEAIRLAPEDSSLLLKRGSTYQFRGESEKAMADLNEYCERTHDDPQALRLIAWIRSTSFDEQVRDGRMALTAATRACDLTNWSDAVCLQSLAAACAECHDFVGAVKWMTKAIDLSSQPRKQELSRILKQFQSNNPFRDVPEINPLPGRQSLRELLNRGTEESAKLTRRALYLAVFGDMDEAIEDLSSAIAISPSDAFLFQLRGIIHWRNRELTLALRDMEECSRLAPTDAVAAYLSGYFHNSKSDYRLAIQDYDRAIRLDPNFGMAYYERGSAKAKFADYEGADRDYTKALEIEPDAPSYMAALAWLRSTCPDEHHRNGAEAVRLAKRACELTEQNDRFLMLALAAASAEVGEFEEAVNWQTKSILITPASELPSSKIFLDLYQSRRPYRTAAGILEQK